MLPYKRLYLKKRRSRKLKKRFPADFTDKEIQEKIDKHVHEVLNLNVKVSPATSIQQTLQVAQVGQNELNLRSQKRFGRASKILSGVSIGLAIVTIFLAATTIWFSQRDMESDQTWRNDQMTELKKNNELLEEQIRINEEVNATQVKILEKLETSVEPGKEQ